MKIPKSTVHLTISMLLSMTNAFADQQVGGDFACPNLPSLMTDPQFVARVASANGLNPMRFWSMETPARVRMATEYAQKLGQCERVAGSTMMNSDRDVIAAALGVQRDRLAVVPSSLQQVRTHAAPAGDNVSSPYAREYSRFLGEAARGGSVLRWQHSGSPKAEGFALVRSGTFVARLVTAIQ